MNWGIRDVSGRSWGWNSRRRRVGSGVQSIGLSVGMAVGAARTGLAVAQGNEDAV